jgi:hypothetical protein
VSEYYPKLPEDSQCLLYSSLGLLACASARTLTEAPSLENNKTQQMKCTLCDDDSRCKSAAATSENPDLEVIIYTVAALIKLPKTHKYKRPRVAAMLAIKRLLSHTANLDHLDLATSPFGQWCLQALHSSIRELRIAAGLVRNLCHILLSLMPVGEHCQSSCKQLVPFLASPKTGLLRWIICVAYPKKATSLCRKRVYLLGDRLLGKMNT